MSRVSRVHDGSVSTLMRDRARARRLALAPDPARTLEGALVPDPVPAATALLVMDAQTTIVERFGDDAVVERIAEAVRSARAASVPVIFVQVGFRPGHPEVSPRNRTFARLRDASGPAAGSEAAMAIHPAVTPAPGEVVVTKRRVSAFAGSDLDVVLRAGAIEHLVLCGIATSGVVLSTLRAAADLDFGLTVLADACADGDDVVHRVLTETVFPRQADVLDVAAWAAALPALSARA